MVLEIRPKIRVKARPSQNGSLRASGSKAKTLVKLVVSSGRNLALMAVAMASAGRFAVLLA